MLRLKEVFHKNASDFREACYHLLGYEISLSQSTMRGELIGH